MSEADGYVIIGTKVDNSGFEKGIGDLEKAEDGVKDLEVTPNVKGGGKMLAIIGAIAVVAIGVVKAFKMIKEENGETWAKLQQIGGALKNLGNVLLTAFGNLFVPILEKIVNFLYTIVSYVNYLAKAWFNVDLFAKSSANDFKKANKAAKEMNKTTLGFDTANILGGSSGSGIGGGASSGTMPKLEDVPIPKWLEWIKDNGELVAGLIAGITVAILVLKLTALDPIALLIAGIIVVVALLVAAIIKYWDEIKAVLSKVWAWINDNVIQPVINLFKTIWGKIVEIFTPVIEFFKSIFTTVWENIKTSFNNIVEIFKFVWNKIKEIFEPVANFLKDIFSKAFNKIKEVFSPIVNFFGDLWNKIKTKLKDWGTKAGEAVGGAFKTVINAILKTIESVLNTPIKAINKLLDVINKVPGINLSKLTEFNLPRLAVGGVVNMPGRGINYGGANIGESGAEGVIPLTNDQSLQMIADAIAQRMNITLDITNKIDGRVLNKQLEQVKAKNSFARNGA